MAEASRQLRSTRRVCLLAGGPDKTLRTPKRGSLESALGLGSATHLKPGIKPDAVAQHGTPDQTDEWADKIAAAVIAAYYPEAVRGGQKSRERVATTFSVFSLIATASLAGLAARQNEGLHAVEGAALLLWFLSAITFALPHVGDPLPARRKFKGRSDFVDFVLQSSRDDANRVRRIQVAGLTLTALAAIVTVVGVSFPTSEESFYGSVHLAQKSQTLEDALCGNGLVVTGHIRLTAEHVEIEPDEVCGSTDLVVLRKESVAVLTSE